MNSIVMLSCMSLLDQKYCAQIAQHFEGYLSVVGLVFVECIYARRGIQVPLVDWPQVRSCVPENVPLSRLDLAVGIAMC